MRGAAVAFADKHLRRRVTLPGSLEADADVISKLDSGDRLDVVSCAVRGCSWRCSACPQGHEYEIEHPFDSELRKHVQEHHGRALYHVATTSGIAVEEIDRIGEAQLMWDLYKQALAVQERRGYPAVGVSVDRRAFEYTNRVYNDTRVRSLICFTGARICLDTGGVRSAIRFRSTSSYLSMPLESLHETCSCAAFGRNYMKSGSPLFQGVEPLPCADFTD